MSDLTDYARQVLSEHRVDYTGGSYFGCTGCPWNGPTPNSHREHVDDLLGAIGTPMRPVTEEERAALPPPIVYSMSIEWWSYRGLDGSVALTPIGTTRDNAIRLRARSAVVEPERLPLVRRWVSPAWEDQP